MEPTSDVVIASNLAKDYGSLRAVDGVSFSVRPGECFGFLGPNGAGKTTVMKMIHGFSPRTSGDLSVFGMDPDRKGPGIKNRLGVVPQDDNLDEELTLAQNLEVYGRYFDLPRKLLKGRIQTLISFMALEGRERSRIDDLSGGMKRRLVIARALLNDPEMIVLDEPTTGLDPQVRHLIWAKLRELKKKGTTLLLTTHYMEEAQNLCDRLLVMDKGRILAAGSSDELIRRELPAFVLETEAWAGPVPGDVRSETYGDLTYLYADSMTALERVAEDLKQDFRIRATGLEDLFLKLTGRDLGDRD